jgi:hypothetical protein
VLLASLPSIKAAFLSTSSSELELFMVPANALKYNAILVVSQNEFVILELKSTRVQ